MFCRRHIDAQNEAQQGYSHQTKAWDDGKRFGNEQRLLHSDTLVMVDENVLTPSYMLDCRQVRQLLVVINSSNKLEDEVRV